MAKPDLELTIKMQIQEKMDEFIFSQILPFCDKYEFHISKQELLDALQLSKNIVRCKDCKHWGRSEVRGETDHVKCCCIGFYMVGENGYCVYGERKDSDG